MKICLFSDLHLHHSGPDYPIDVPDGVDVVVVPGDVSAPCTESLMWLFRNVASQRVPVVFVAGNHEYYGHVYETSLAEARARRHEFPGVHWLENEEVVLGGVRFLGATMWTDFELYGTPEISMKKGRAGLNDFFHIRTARTSYSAMRPEDQAAIHKESRAWLNDALARPFEGKTAVVTHHCPHWMSIAPAYAGDPMNPCFTSDFSAEIERYGPDVWFHGHTHTAFDYVVPGTETRIVCKPRGYDYIKKNGERETENPGYSPYNIIEI